ncbi:hypothetical protein EON68_02335, partial [archaeon]
MSTFLYASRVHCARRHTRVRAYARARARGRLQDFDDALRQLYDVYEAAPHIVRQYVPQLTNFLLHGGMPGAERLEVFLLGKAERSLHFAHRLHFFLNAYAPNVGYHSQLCGAVQTTGLLNESLLLRAVEVQGAIAANRMAHAASVLPLHIEDAAALAHDGTAAAAAATPAARRPHSARMPHAPDASAVHDGAGASHPAAAAGTLVRPWNPVVRTQSGSTARGATAHGQPASPQTEAECFLQVASPVERAAGLALASTRSAEHALVADPDVSLVRGSSTGGASVKASDGAHKSRTGAAQSATTLATRAAPRSAPALSVSSARGGEVSPPTSLISPIVDADLERIRSQLASAPINTAPPAHQTQRPTRATLSSPQVMPHRSAAWRRQLARPRQVAV